MRKMTTVLVMVLAIASSVSAGYGHTEVKPVLYVGAGVNAPVSPSALPDYWNMGIGVGGGIGFQVVPRLELVSRFYFNSFKFDGDQFLSELGLLGGRVEGLDFRAVEFGAEMKFFLIPEEEKRVTPFLAAGGGAAHVKFTDATVSAGGESVDLPMSAFSETQLAASIGGGFDYMYSSTNGVWVDVRWTMLTSNIESTSYIPIRIGLKILFGK